MITLGIDPGQRNLGWCIVEGDADDIDTVHGLGVVRLELDEDIPIAINAMRFGMKLAHALRGIITAASSCRLDAIAVESMMLFGAPQAIVANAQPHGVIACLAVVLDIELVAIAPTRWQKAIAPGPGKADLARVYASVMAVVDACGTATARRQLHELRQRPLVDRGHAIDAAGIAMYRTLGHPTHTINPRT